MLSVSKEGTPAHVYERDTWAPLADLATNHPEAGVHFQGTFLLLFPIPSPLTANLDTILYNRSKDIDSSTPISKWQSELTRPDPWYASVVPSFHLLSQDSLPPNMASAIGFTSVCINTALYLPYLASRCLAARCTLKRGIISHITSAASLHSSGRPASIIINCTGLGARKLGGVEDAAVVPVRGQITIVRNDPKIMSGVSGTDDGEDECTYIMHRAAGGGCVLGGCYQKGNEDGTVDMAMAERIMRRCVEACPELVGGKGKGVEALSVVRHGVGLRPVREGGPRVELEWMTHARDVETESDQQRPVNQANGNTGSSPPSSGSGIWIVHQYGHGGAGYQSSYGSAQAAVRLVEEALQKNKAGKE